MPAPLGEDAGAAADAARFGQTPGEEARSLENRPAGGRACLEPRMAFASLRLGPRDEGAAAPVVPEARG